MTTIKQFEEIHHSLYQDGVDLDGCETAADVLKAVKAQSPESLDSVILGDDANQPTLRERLSEDTCALIEVI